MKKEFLGYRAGGYAFMRFRGFDIRLERGKPMKPEDRRQKGAED